MIENQKLAKVSELYEEINENDTDKIRGGLLDKPCASGPRLPNGKCPQLERYFPRGQFYPRR